jgi:dolichol-phosphate mannosyltransferase
VRCTGGSARFRPNLSLAQILREDENDLVQGTRATICLPTFNELENLELMVNALSKVIRPADRVLVIDDASPDGTGAVADRLARELPFVDVLHRPAKLGLGPAYVAGFGRAIDDGADLVLQMDCDFSHAPSDVPRLIDCVERGADVALGSRYVSGGSIGDWGFVRRAISIGGSFYARTILGLPIRDLTGGFKCFRAEVLRAINIGDVGTKGYAFQIEMTYRAAKAGFEIVEIPIHFVDRTRGSTKMSKSIVMEAVVAVPLLRARGRSRPSARKADRVRLEEGSQTQQASEPLTRADRPRHR